MSVAIKNLRKNRAIGQFWNLTVIPISDFVP